MRPTRIFLRANSLVVALIAATGLLSFSGCGDGKISRYPVKGQVLVDGKPVEGALVIFCPTEGPPELMKERPYGRTDAQGAYDLRTFEPGDGAPAGNYKIMVRWVVAGPAGDRSDRAATGGDRLRGRYTNPEQSGLTYVVKEEPNQVPPFELTTK